MKFILFCLFLPFFAWAKDTTALVEYVLDGDTFVTARGDTVRLLGINTPEPGTSRRPAEPWGLQASDFTKKLLENQKINITTQAKDRDRYGRVLANVFLSDGTWVNEHLLREGVAHVYTFPDSSYDIKALFAAENAAREAKKGIWALPRWSIKNAVTCCKKEEIGEFQVVEGAIKQVVTVKNRTYLNFGTDWRTDFTVEIERKNWSKFSDLKQKRGKKVRIRGYIKPINGALVTVTHPEQIETLE
ncbi:MAG: thermonuclease family protein [Alphaproteobacteria bacterium]|nr:thermonuclease family protein [Alphaproteobacteria bacterium]MDD9920303.1 thermonuclease family protein [Alphaproteobacteria bacterium]